MNSAAVEAAKSIKQIFVHLQNHVQEGLLLLFLQGLTESQVGVGWEGSQSSSPPRPCQGCGGEWVMLLFVQVLLLVLCARGAVGLEDESGNPL